MRTANRQTALKFVIIFITGLSVMLSEMNGSDDMADIVKKIPKLNEKIGKLKERIQTNTAEYEKLSEQKSLLCSTIPIKLTKQEPLIHIMVLEKE